MSYNRNENETIEDYSNRIYEEIKNNDLDYALNKWGPELDKFTSDVFERTDTSYDKLTDWMTSLNIPEEYQEEIFVNDYSNSVYDSVKNPQLEAEINRWSSDKTLLTFVKGTLERTDATRDEIINYLTGLDIPMDYLDKVSQRYNISASNSSSNDTSNIDNVATNTSSPTNPLQGTTTITTNNGAFGVDPNSIITCYIVNKITDEVIKFPAYPTEMSESYSSSYTQTDIVGRSSPYFSFGGNPARSFDFPLTIQEDIVKDMTLLVEKLKALVYPNYVGSIVQPPYCYVKFGDMLSCYAIVESISFSWGETILDGSQHFSKCDVSFSFQEMRQSMLPTAYGPFNEV